MRKILYERGDGAVTRRHLQIQLENAGVETRDRCRPKMKAVLVGQPSFAFLFKRFPFFFIFSPISIGSERGDVDGVRERGNKC